MKKMFVAVMALSLTISLFNGANAGTMDGTGGGCGKCAQQSGSTSADPLRKFQADTIDLRQEMMTKRFEVQRENLKGTPDTTKITALQADIRNIQAKILDIRSKSGLPAGKSDGECGQKPGGCGHKGMGGCNGPCGKQ
jgi:hypothetical protein